VSDGGPAVIQNIANAIAATTPRATAAVVSASAIGELLMESFSEFMWILDTFSAFIIVLAAVTALFLIVMRRAADEGARRLWPLGLSRAANVRHNIFAIFFALLPVFIFAPLFTFIIRAATLPVFRVFGMRAIMVVNPLVMLLTIAVCFAFLVAAEAVICAISSSKGQITSH
jgi:type III secretory pathway component EscU